MANGKVYLADNLDILSRLPNESVDLVYIDPPFNTGKKQMRQNAKMSRVDIGKGDREGFGGNRYVVGDLGEVMSYEDTYRDAYIAFLKLRLIHLHRILKPSGSLYLHLDYREAAYARIVGDEIFGRKNFLNEIIWAFDYGGKPKNRWPAKHNNILMWVKNYGSHVFNVEDIDREPYMAPGMVSEEKARRGKLPTSCYSADTEVLTLSGWKLFSDVVESDSLATVSTDRDLTFVTPSALHSYPYVGTMYRFVAAGVDLMVTPDHQMYVGQNPDSTFSFISAQALGHSEAAFDCLFLSVSSATHEFEESRLVSRQSMEYSGMVYCATVDPHHTLVVRRNGKSSVCGNCWWHTIVSPTGHEKTGYPTQKPIQIIERIIRASSPVGGLVLDCFGGSGTTGEAALKLDRNFIMVDNNPEAIGVMKQRFEPYREAGHKIRFMKSKSAESSNV